MRLPLPFIRLPVRFDLARLRAEVASLPEEVWAPHPNHIAGNTSLRLVSVEGGENDDVDGVMRPTPHLAKLPYVRQVLASFGVVWSRSRLLRLDPGAVVPEHADINYHWFYRVRVHIPIVTRPEVLFHCGGETVHMRGGEAWLFDNWRLHRVENPTPEARIHLVADTSGSASFWQFVAQAAQPGMVDRELRFDPARDGVLLTEQSPLRPVMSPGEVDYLVGDLRSELVPSVDAPESRARLARYHQLLDGFVRDWRQVYSLFGERADARGQFEQLRDTARTASRELAEGLMMRTNRVAAHPVFEGRVLRSVLPQKPGTASVKIPRIERPVFIIAAPRSGSTLLFETLAESHSICTLGGEAHGAIEGAQPSLRPGAPGVDSNRLERQHATPEVIRRLHEEFAAQRRPAPGAHGADVAGLRFLEKTPKNALRIPFLEAAFPDAQFIFLWREPRANLASIIEAWKAGRWVTYRGLDELPDPWSLLLPPGWREMRDKPLPEIAAFQWETANRIALDDLSKIDRSRWTAVTYEELVANPRAVVERLTKFIGIGIDAGLEQRLAAPLPPSRQTNTLPDTQKWRLHEAVIEPLLSNLTPIVTRLRALSGPT
ncbi:MAG TPA: sulfotransferase [Steroidobacteraceae bacterium]|nr:sulfotransferase [Steroidobacteraceae bacterium]